MNPGTQTPHLIKVGAPIMRWICCPPHSTPRNGLDFREGIDYACANTKRKGYDMFLAIGKEMIDAEVTDAEEFYGLSPEDIAAIKSIDSDTIDKYIFRNAHDDFYEALDRLKYDVIHAIIADKLSS